MDNEMKFYLLAELSGWNCRPYIQDERERLLQSEAYTILSKNVREAKKHLSGKAQDIVRSYEKLRIDPKSVYQTFLLEESIDYLALHSFPEYYVNPLAIDPDYKGPLDTIGQLMVEVEGRDLSINDIILDKEIPARVKKEAVYQKLDGDYVDMARIVERSIASARKKMRQTARSTFSTLLRALEVVFFILANAFLFLMFARPFDVFLSFLTNPDPVRAMTYVVYVYPILVFLYDLAFVTFESYKTRVREPYTYAVHFLNRQADTVLSGLAQTRDDLYDYVCGAINNRIELRGDITDFSRLKDAYIDFKALVLSESFKKKKTYRFLRALQLTMTTLVLLAFLFSLVIYVLGSVFNVAV